MGRRKVIPERKAGCHKERRYFAHGLCKPCYHKLPAHKQRNKKWKLNNKIRLKAWYKEYHLIKAYGLTRVDFNKRLQKQEGHCALCSRRKYLCVDHHHVTRVIRGILCKRCNTGLGIFGDDPARLRKAIKYLRRKP